MTLAKIIFHPLFRFQFSNLRRYKRLYDQIGQFYNLRNLRLTFRSDKHLSYLDGLIDQYPRLNKLSFSADIQQITRSNELPFSTAIRRITGRNQLVPIILPRPEIKRLECNLGLINTASQLEYVMQQFRNDQS